MGRGNRGWGATLNKNKQKYVYIKVGSRSQRSRKPSRSLPFCLIGALTPLSFPLLVPPIPPDRRALGFFGLAPNAYSCFVFLMLRCSCPRPVAGILIGSEQEVSRHISCASSHRYRYQGTIIIWQREMCVRERIHEGKQGVQHKTKNNKGQHNKCQEGAVCAAQGGVDIYKELSKILVAIQHFFVFVRLPICLQLRLHTSASPAQHIKKTKKIRTSLQLKTIVCQRTCYPQAQ